LTLDPILIEKGLDDEDVDAGYMVGVQLWFTALACINYPNCISWKGTVSFLR